MRRGLLTLGAWVLTAAMAWAQAPVVVEYYHLDAVGSVRAITDQARNAVVFDYAPFGDGGVGGGASPAALRFAGKERDPETGLDYFGARYYASRSGRFTTVDPVTTVQDNWLDPQRWNRYAYALNNPRRYTDPDGRWIETLWDLANVALGAKSAFDNFRSGHVASGIVDTGGVVVDLAAAVLPVVPGGVGTAIKAARAADRADDLADVAKVVRLSRARHGEAAIHAEEAIRAGQPAVLTLERTGAAANRQASLGGVAKVRGRHLDEYPPAMFKEGGAGASVRPISPRDNMAAGACIGNACRSLANGARIRIEIEK